MMTIDPDYILLVLLVHFMCNDGNHGTNTPCFECSIGRIIELN